MKHLKYILAATVILLAVGCKKNEPISDDPHHDDPRVEDPEWQVLDKDINLSSTMTIIAATEDMSMDDRLAVFSDGICVGMVQPIDAGAFGLRCYLCVYMPANPDLPLTLAYYSANRHRVVYWTDCLEYEHDGVVGSVDEPYLLN